MDAFEHGYTIADNLNHILSVKGMTVVELSNITGVLAPTIYSIKQGRSKNPTINVLKKIAHGLGCSLNDLVEVNVIEQ